MLSLVRPDRLLFTGYVLAFAGAALGCLVGAWRASRIQVPDTRRGLVGLLGASAGWATLNLAYIAGPALGIGPLGQAWLYDLGLVCGFATVWAWLYFCFALAGRGLHRSVRAQALGLSVFGIVTLTKVTNPLHGLYFTTTAGTEPFRHLAVDLHGLFWVSLGLSYGMAGIGYVVLCEFLSQIRDGTRPLAVLFGLMALPAFLNAAGYAHPLLLDISHEPLGVAAFAIGALFVYSDRFRNVSLMSRDDGPVLIVGADGYLRACNEAATDLFPVLATTGSPPARPEELLPGLQEALESGTPLTVGEGPGRRSYRVNASSLDGGTANGGTLVRLSEVTEQQRRRRLEEARREGVAKSLSGLQFQYYAVPGQAPAYWYVGERAEEVLGISSELDGFEERFLARVPETYHEQYWSCVEEGGEEGDTYRAEVPFNRPDGEQIWLLLASQAKRLHVPGNGEGVVFSGVMLDITEQKRARARADLQATVLRKVAEGRPLRETLTVLVEGLEDLCPRMLGSVLLRNRKGDVLRHGAAPSLPDEYVRAVDGLPVGPGEGSCGSAAYSGEAVVAEDIAADPRWKSYRDLALRHKLRASWSAPVKGSEGEVLGTFAMYYREPKAPSETDRALIEEAQSLARIAIERHHNAERLRLLSESVSQSTEAVLITEAENLDPPGPAIVYANQAFEEMTGYDQAEIQGETPRLLQGPETERDTLDSLRSALEAGTSWEGETTNYRKDGTPYRVRWKVAPVTGEDGSIEYWTSVQRDVTDRRKREEQLRRRKGLLEQTQRLAGAWEVDRRSGTLSWTEEVYRIHELDPSADISLKTALRFYPPEGRQKIQAAFRRCVVSGTPYDVEVPLVTAKGTRRWVRAVGAPTRVEGGRVVTVAGAFQDITDRKEAEQQLERSRERLQMAVEGGNIGTWDWDLETGTVIFNRQWAEMLGYSREELDFHFSTWEELVHPDDLTQAKEVLSDYLEGARDTYDPEIRMRTKSGDWKWIQTIGKVVDRDEEGNVRRAAGIHLDIDERKRAENALRERESQIRGLAESAPGTLFRLSADEDGTYHLSFIGEQADALLGVPPDQPTPFESVVERIPPSHREGFLQSIAEAVERAEPWRHEIPFDRPGRGRIWLRGAATPETEGRDNGRVVFSGIFTDITDQKRRERELVEAKEEAEQMNRLKSAFLANMSHEIRTPLTSIIGFAEAIGEETQGADRPEAIDLSTLSRFSGLIQKSGRRLMETLDSVLNLSRLEAGEIELELGPVDLTAGVEETVEQFTPQAEEADVCLSVQSASHPVWARADDGGVRIVLRNLISNAIKYTDEGGQVWVRVRQDDETATVEVEDTGRGMNPAQVDQLFEAFKQGSEGIDREYEGAGVGLAVTKKMLAEMDGTIAVETEEGTGSRFTVRLPRAARTGGGDGERRR